MKKRLTAFFILQGFLPALFGQPERDYWQQQVNYNINVTLDDKQHSLNGFERIEYINNSPDTLTYIWFHIWPNAYKNDQTAFSDQALLNGNTKFYFSDREQKGYINRLDFRVDDVTAETEDHPQHIDIIKLVLPKPLPPSQRITITTPFHVKLPYNFSRGGHDGQSYQLTQWYPKPAVYDREGWHPMPYLDQGEYYSEFGNFDVTITLPENYVVASTGNLQNAEEKEWLKTRGNFTWEPVKRRVKRGSNVKTIVQQFPESATTTKTLRFRQENVHDFAWFADKRFIVQQDTCLLASGKIVEIFSYYTPAQKEYWKNSVALSKDAVRTRSSWIGEYPYSQVSVVQGPASFGGGMEYPTITVISPLEDERLLEYTIVHEISHNWFYGILGSNERKYPWLDEGLNTYYDNRYSQWKYGDKGELKIGASTVQIKNGERILFESLARAKKDQPIQTQSENLSAINYGLIAYYKTGAWLEWLDSLIGRDNFDKAMQDYYRRWQFKHPQPGDLKTVFEQNTNRDLDSVFALLDQRGLLPQQQRTGTKTAFIFNTRSHAAFINDPAKHYIVFGPALGFNIYDKLMLGGFVTNYKLPPSGLQFFAAPMYATGSKNFAGTGLVNYSFYPEGLFRKVSIGVSASTFTMNEFEDQQGSKTFASYYKVVPSLKLIVKEKDLRRQIHQFIQFKSFFIGEDGFNFYRDTIINSPGDTTVLNRARTSNESRVLNQLRIVSENNRVLYPYRGELKLEQGTDFIRAAFTGNYFFNYAKGGGLNVRFFAGKFFYTGEKTIIKQFETDRYHLNMTGPNGFEDYTYSDYFLGRNEFEGLASQQIMVRDGGFKVRTELLADKIGKTDDWLMAANFSTSIPANLNPLSVFPVKIPLKIFVDIGTYAGAWEKDAEGDRFLYDAGLQVPLFNEVVNVYIPVLYSKVYKDYIQSTLEKKNRFFKTISFSIDISGINFRKWSRNLVD